MLKNWEGAMLDNIMKGITKSKKFTYNAKNSKTNKVDLQCQKSIFETNEHKAIIVHNG